MAQGVDDNTGGVMKFYIVMGGLHLYPNGGFEDFKKKCDTLEEAKSFADEHLNLEEWTDGWWAWANVGEITEAGVNSQIWRRYDHDDEWTPFSLV